MWIRHRTTSTSTLLPRPQPPLQTPRHPRPHPRFPCASPCIRMRTVRSRSDSSGEWRYGEFPVEKARVNKSLAITHDSTSIRRPIGKSIENKTHALRPIKQISVQTPQHRFMCNDQHVVLLALELQDAGFNADSEIVI